MSSFSFWKRAALVALASSLAAASASYANVLELKKELPGMYSFHDNVSGSFSDYVTFSVTSESPAHWDATALGLGFNNFSSLDLYLYGGRISPADPLPQTAIWHEAGDGSSYSSFFHVATADGDRFLASGIYTLFLTGWASSDPGLPSYVHGNLIGAFAAAAPVPEPAEGAMLISGLGLMAFVARRRSRARAQSVVQRA
jgi:hypothetical protein